MRLIEKIEKIYKRLTDKIKYQGFKKTLLDR